jgi:hypothetical protein
MKILQFVSIFLVSSGATSFAGLPGGAQRPVAVASGVVSEVAPDWKIVCFGEGEDIYGDGTAHKHCRVEKDNFHTIAIVTARGLSIPLRSSNTPCRSVKGQITVDGNYVAKKPLREEIAAMSAGHVFARTYQTAWPECAKLDEYTGLEGFPAALSHLKARWRKFR